MFIHTYIYMTKTVKFMNICVSLSKPISMGMWEQNNLANVNLKGKYSSLFFNQYLKCYTSLLRNFKAKHRSRGHKKGEVFT